MEFKLRFFGSVLGYLWQLMRPLLLFGILYAVFTQFVRLGEGIPFYPAILLTGVMLYTFFADATSGSVTAVLDRENLVRKIEFPRLVVPVSVILLAYFNLTLNLIAVLVFVLATGVDPRWEWFALPLLLIPTRGLCGWPGHVALGPVRPVSRSEADLGSGGSDRFLRLTDHLRD